MVVLPPIIESFIARMPKVELHLHLEGAIRPHTILELAQQNGIELPIFGIANIEELFLYHDFKDFLNVFIQLTRVIVHPEDFERLGYELGISLASQRVLYAEVMLSPMQHVLRGINLFDVVRASVRGFRQAERETGIQIRLILDYGRQYGPEYAWYILEAAKQMMDDGVVGWSIGGDEIHFPPEPFADVFAAAREAGLHVTAHAGEVVGPPSVWGAVDVLHVDRIGHGIQSIDDPKLVSHLCEQQVVLDVCPSSNLLTGAVASWEQHPLRRLYDAGVCVTVNSDDPTFFRTTLVDEYRAIAYHHNFSIDDICVLMVNAASASFLPSREKTALLARVQHELKVLREELDV